MFIPMAADYPPGVLADDQYNALSRAIVLELVRQCL